MVGVVVCYCHIDDFGIVFVLVEYYFVFIWFDFGVDGF